MNEFDFIVIVVIHFIADYVFQREVDAQNKSKDVGHLLIHTCMYSFVTFFLYMGLFIVQGRGVEMFTNVMTFTGLTFIFHTVTDYITSVKVAKQFEDKEYGSDVPNLGGFTTIGLDQVFHYVQLVLTYAKYLV